MATATSAPLWRLEIHDINVQQVDCTLGAL
jgi:hypothetical protein